jgi:MFS transporter, DHA2 family, multidrug resistance protein
MAAEQAAGGGNRLAITVCVILATLMQALDTTIANVALPYMQGSVSATQDQIDWVLTSYIVAAAIMTPPTGFLAGRTESIVALVFYLRVIFSKNRCPLFQITL